MVCTERIDKTHLMAESFAEAKSALDGVFRFYKWRRHAKGFPEEVYLLLSRCAHVCFSLWRSDQESEGDFFRRSPPPTAFWIGLDFGKLRGSEPEEPVSPTDWRADHLTNDTKWFEFWMKILEQSDPRGALIFREFSRHILACTGHGNLLEGKTGYRSRKALHLFLKTDEAGRVLLRTLSVLQDLVQAILRYFATLDGRTCVLEKITLLTGLLSEIRQIIVWETSASGPYSPSGDARWRVRSPLTWLSRDRTQGVLTVIPRREGGEIICIYRPPSDPKGRRLSWVRKVASLKGTYEEALFATWSYETGEHRKNPQQFPGVTAGWTVQYAEAQRLETLARQVDLLLAALQGNPRCQRLVEAVRGILRNGSSRWKATALPWTYVRQLDQLLEKLTLVYREANTSGGGDAAERLVAQNWASGETTTGGVGPSRGPNCPGGEVSREAASQDMTFALSDVKFVLPKANRDALDKPQQSSGSCEPFSSRPSTREDSLTARSPEAKVETAVETPPEKPESSEQSPEAEVETAVKKPPEEPALSEQSPEATVETTVEKPPEEPELSEQSPEAKVETTAEKPPEEPESSEQSPEAKVETTVEKPPEKPGSSGEDSRAEDSAPVPQENPAPAAPGVIGCVNQLLPAVAVPSAEPMETGADRAVVPASPEEPAPTPARVRRTTNESRLSEMAGVLLLKLLEHHAGPGGTRNYVPLSATELRHDLDWNQSQIRRAMTNIFGPKPFGAYKEKCEDRTISTFLKTRATGVQQPVR
jgi:hypothetical protein